jgi:hypothetical protein
VGTPASDIVQRTAAGGHPGLFTGGRALEDDWPVLMAEVLAHSTSGLARGA